MNRGAEAFEGEKFMWYYYHVILIELTKEFERWLRIC